MRYLLALTVLFFCFSSSAAEDVVIRRPGSLEPEISSEFKSVKDCGGKNQHGFCLEIRSRGLCKYRDDARVYCKSTCALC
ncbi:hypothetical protein OESDEN_00598 [Oesophagostomum dentatum]|uniref:ShTK domain protein n=1 Tax=Oesophagostomum dentatum TaxID=61180 RepID=A0A0B1TPC8_OESDE|nr:hypothetical protein OESDEN_00598 [Oesophagostomum dentatum]